MGVRLAFSPVMEGLRLPIVRSRYVVARDATMTWVRNAEAIRPSFRGQKSEAGDQNRNYDAVSGRS